MKRTREENSPSRVRKEGSTPSVGDGSGKASGGGSAVDAKARKSDAADPPPSASGEAHEAPPPKKPASAKPTAAEPAGKAEGSGGGKGSSGGGARAAAGAGRGKEAAGGAGAGDEVVEPPPDVEGIPNETLFVGNLSYRVSEAVIIKLFTPYGRVVREQFCYHKVGPRLGEPRGFCFVEYSNVEDAAKAIRALHGRKLYGRPLRVRFMTVEGSGRMDYSTTDNKSASGGSFVNNGDGAKIPPAPGAGAEAGAGVTKLSLDKQVALLKLKLREARQSGKR